MTFKHMETGYMAKQARNTICLWFDRDAEEAAEVLLR
jgi:hypothetical protein